MSAILPLIKPYEATVQTAAEMLDTTYMEADEELYERLCDLGLSKIDVVIYVNWASHNALTYDELTQHLDISRDEIKWRMQKLRRVFPHLFCSGSDLPA
jgi:membrane-anchored protein YejM (alkaline phosphatase superfamily)